MKILVINAGSSSIKYQLFEMPAEKVLAKGLLEKIGEEDSRLNHFGDSKEQKICGRKKRVSVVLATPYGGTFFCLFA